MYSNPGGRIDAFFASVSFLVIMGFFDHMTTLAGVEKCAWMLVSFLII